MARGKWTEESKAKAKERRKQEDAKLTFIEQIRPPVKVQPRYEYRRVNHSPMLRKEQVDAEFNELGELGFIFVQADSLGHHVFVREI